MSDVLEIANFPCTELVCDIGSGAQVLYLGVVMTSVEGSSFLLSCTCSLCLGLDWSVYSHQNTQKGDGTWTPCIIFWSLFLLLCQKFTSSCNVVLLLPRMCVGNFASVLLELHHPSLCCLRFVEWIGLESIFKGCPV